MKFPESALAHKYCIGQGIEIGAAAHNAFNLPNCINVGIHDDEDFYRQHQIEMCGKYATIDYYAKADVLGCRFKDNSLDYIVSSHVIEHLQDLIGTFIEWNRVLKNDGIVFMIFPKRDALPDDIGRPLSTIADFVQNHNNPPKVFDSTKHVWVFDLQLMINLIQYCANYYNLNWTVIDSQETDDKVGNGHTVVVRVKK